MIEPRREVDLRLAELKRSGAHPVAAIKTICGEFGLSLSEAKNRFARSQAWASDQAAADQLHQQILEATRGEGTD
jgi:ribosomal protein L7/L12